MVRIGIGILFILALCGWGTFPSQMDSVDVASSTCSTCSNGLQQAFILDDGEADLDDWVGANNITNNGASWAASNDGLVFDGSSDYATFPPTLTSWQSGSTVAILSTVDNSSADNYIFYQYASTDTDVNIRLKSSTYPAYNRLMFRQGRHYDDKTIDLYIATGDSTKQWYFADYDDTDGHLYKNKTLEASDTDVTEYASDNMDTGYLGAQSSSVNNSAVTIYRVLIWNRELTADERTAIVDEGWTPTHD